MRAIERAYERFLIRPTREGFLDVRQRLINSPAWPPSAEDVARIIGFTAGHEAVGGIHAWIERVWPTWVICPRVHYLSAVAAGEAGDGVAQEQSRFEMRTCLQGLLATGDGSLANPIVVTYLTDVEDVLAALGKRRRAQHLVWRAEECHDLISCDDGSELWFDATALVPVPSGTIRPLEAASAPRRHG